MLSLICREKDNPDIAKGMTARHTELILQRAILESPARPSGSICQGASSYSNVFQPILTSLISITKKANRKEHIPTSRSKRANTKPVSRRETHTKGYMNPTKRETLSFILGYSAQAPYRDPAHSALEFHCGDQYLRPSKSPCSPMSPPQPHQRYSYSRRGPT